MRDTLGARCGQLRRKGVDPNKKEVQKEEAGSIVDNVLLTQKFGRKH